MQTAKLGLIHRVRVSYVRPTVQQQADIPAEVVRMIYIVTRDAEQVYWLL